jgi:hypothetical protein
MLSPSRKPRKVGTTSVNGGREEKAESPQRLEAVAMDNKVCPGRTKLVSNPWKHRRIDNPRLSGVQNGSGDDTDAQCRFRNPSGA